MEFFNLHKSYFKVTTFLNQTDPINYQGTYGDFSSLLGQLTFQKFMGLNEDKQIFLMNNTKKIDFIVKRYVHECLKEVNDPFQSNDESLISFFNHAFKEYELSKIIWAHPNSVATYDMKITRLIQDQLIVSEFIMEYGGQNLFKALNIVIQNPQLIKKILKQTSSVFAFIEMYKILYNDVKLENFVIDLQNGIIRLIDFDVSQGKKSHHSTAGKKKTITGFTEGYVAPEVVTQLYNSMKGIESTYNPWRADVYSWGIMVLILLRGSTTNFINSKNFDKWKLSKEDHNTNIFPLIDKISFPNDNEMTHKMKTILKYCLSYSPENRATFETINNLLNNIDTYSVYSVESPLATCVKEALTKSQSSISLSSSIIQTGTPNTPKVEGKTNKENYNTPNHFQNQNPLVSELQSENNRLKEENKKLKEQHENDLDKMDSLRGNVQQLKNKVSEYDYNLADNKPSFNSKKLQEYEKEVNQLRSELNEAKRSNQNSINDQKAKIQNLENQVDHSKSELKNANNKLERLYDQTLETLAKHKSNFQLEKVEDIPDLVNQLILREKLMPLVNLLTEVSSSDDTIKGPCIVCDAEQNYPSMLKCISNSSNITSNTKKVLNSNRKSWSFLNTNISKFDAKAIISLLKVNDSITMIDLSFNQNVDNDIGIMFERVIKEHPSLREFYLHMTKIPPKKQFEICLAAKSLKNLRQFTLDYESISNDMAFICNALLNYTFKTGFFNDKGEFQDSKVVSIGGLKLIFGSKECVLIKPAGINLFN